MRLSHLSTIWTYFISERPHTERSSSVLVVASWETVAGLQRLEAVSCQAEAAGRRRILPLLGHRCVLRVREAEVQTGCEGGTKHTSTCCQVT